MKVVGLTGGIASGKSTAAAHFARMGAAIVDADAIARKILDVGTPYLEQVAAAFGEQMIRADGSLDRAKLGERVFGEVAAREQLNAIVHPAIIAETKKATCAFAKQGAQVVIWDVPLLFETGMDAYCDETVLVHTDTETQIKRVMERDGLSRAQAQARMQSQMSLEEKKKRASLCVDTSASAQTTQELLTCIGEEWGLGIG